MEEERETNYENDVNTYKMRPTINEMFRANKVKQIIQKILSEKLSGKVYSAEDAKKWTFEISGEVNKAVKGIEMSRYKHIVQVALGQQVGSGCRYITRCVWDAESDAFTSEVFTNATLFCVCTVFGVYLY